MSDRDPIWSVGLKRNGQYFEGFVSSAADVLALHKRDTVTTWGTRTSRRCDGNKEDKVNIAINIMMIPGISVLVCM